MLKSLLCLLTAAPLAAADFPADTLLRSRMVQNFTEPGFDYDIATFTYGRDAKDWLHETMVVNEKSGYLHTMVTITDREGRYRGGSYQKRQDPVILFEAEHDAQGRLSRKILRTPNGVFYQDHVYDARGGLSEINEYKAGSMVAAERTLWTNTYDGAGRMVTSVQYGPEDDFSPWDRKRFFDPVTGRVLYMLAWTGSTGTQDRWDSTAYVYAQDGRLLEERRHEWGGKLDLVVTWEYQVFQVPLGLSRRKPGTESLAGYPRAGFDPLGRAVTRRTAAGFPLLYRPR